MWAYIKSFVFTQPQPSAKEEKASVQPFDEPWRKIKWNSKTELEEEVKQLALFNPDIKYLRCVMMGTVGAGKSSFVNSVNNVFQNRITNKAIMATLSEQSCTENYRGYKIKNGESGTLQFMFFDTMGVEKEAGKGLHVRDLENALLGYLPDGYKFNPQSFMSPGDAGYINKSALDEKAHCLICAVNGNTASQLDNETVAKMKQNIKTAAKLGIPQVIVMTKIDEICPLVKKDLKNVYKSKKIKEKMQECSNDLSVPMTCIFPVKNYHEETETDDDIDVLLLHALKQIVHFANDNTEVL